MNPTRASQYRSTLRGCRAERSPNVRAASGFRLVRERLDIFAVLTPACFSLLFSVMAWPLRLSSQVTIGFTGEPARPIVDANGMPRSICVAWFAPIDSLSESRPTTPLSR